MSPLRRLRSLAADAGVRATAVTRIIALAGAPVSIYLAATRFAPRMQGYYFVAVNVIALAQLFEIGLGTIIVQFASHEWPLLRWGLDGALEGDPGGRSAVHVVLGIAVRWYARAALALLVIAGAGGMLLYGATYPGPEIGFAAGWFGFVALTSLYLLVIPFVAVAEGCGDLLSVQRMRSRQAVALLAALWTGIVFTSPLVAACLGAATQLAIVVAWLGVRHRGLIREWRSEEAGADVKAVALDARVRHQQWQSARLWLSLWIAPQLLTPIALRLLGGDEAGRLGVTLAIALAPLSLAAAWLHGRYPSFGALVSQGRLAEFDALARRATAESVAVFLAAALALTAAVLLLPTILPRVASRVLPLGSLLALFAGALVSLVLQAMAGWLRAFRDDTIAGPVAAGAAATVIASGLAASIAGVPQMTAAFAAAGVFVAAPLAAVHFVRVRRERLG